MPILLALFSALSTASPTTAAGGRRGRRRRSSSRSSASSASADADGGRRPRARRSVPRGGRRRRGAAAAGIASTIGVTAFYYALANGAMTVVAPITAVVSAVVRSRRRRARRAPGRRCALVGRRRWRSSRWPSSAASAGRRRATDAAGHRCSCAVVAGVGFGLLFVFLDRTSDDSGLWPLLIAQVTSLLIARTIVRRSPIRATPAACGRSSA